MKFVLIKENLDDQQRLDTVFQRVLKVTSLEKSAFWLREKAFETLPSEGILNKVVAGDVAGMKFVYTEGGVKKALAKLAAEVMWVDGDELAGFGAVFLELPAGTFEPDLVDEFIAMLLQIENCLREAGEKAAHAVVVADAGTLTAGHLEQVKDWLEEVEFEEI
uniref:Histidine kinase n=1 Tax=Panagrellus redivivus TaxID=6233 RepID=A0A7E4W325_PANRE